MRRLAAYRSVFDVFRIMPDGIMQGHLVNPDNRPSNISFERID